MKTNPHSTTRSLVLAALFLALAFVLPMITGHVPQVGNMLCPMHFPILLCGFVLGGPWGLAVGFIAPLVRSVLFGMPPMFPIAIAMAFELAAANTLGIQVSLPAAIVLSAMSALGACGASGVAGGSLLLIPMACSLFGISNDVAMQMVGVGFIIGVVQDSVETALNSAGDVEFAATAEYHQWRKQGKPLPEFLTGKKN